MEPETYFLIAMLFVVIAAILTLAYHILVQLTEEWQEKKRWQNFQHGWSRWGDITDIKGERK